MPSRREMIQMSPADVNAFLRSHKTVIIVSNGPGGFPHPMPMWFAVDDDNTVWMTTFRKSQKILNLTRDPRVSLLVEAGDQYDQLQGVVVYGRAEIVDELEAVKAVLKRVGGVGDSPDPKAREMADRVITGTASKRVLIKVRPDKVVSWDHRKLGGSY